MATPDGLRVEVMRDLETKRPTHVTICDGDGMVLGGWTEGHREVWAIALRDKDRVRDLVRLQLGTEALDRGGLR